MAGSTTNLGLIKPLGTEKIRIAQINQNSDTLDAAIGAVGSTSLQTQMNNVQDALAIIANGDSHAAITAGQFVYVKNNTHSVAEGLHVATANISANGQITTSNVSADASGGLNALNAKITSKEWSPSEGDSLLTWLLANIPDRTKLPFSFMKKGASAVSDSPFKASVEFSGIVDGHGDRLNVTLTSYNNSKKYYRAIWQNNWNGSWTEVFVKDKRSFTLADGESSVIACESDSGGLFIFKATASNLEYIVVKGYAWINRYARGVSSTNVYEFNYTNAANITFSADDNGIKVTNNSGKEVSCYVVFYPVLKS